MAVSISSSIIACLQSFNNFVEIIHDTSLRKPEGLSVGAWEDELGRLRVWAANIGAHQTNQSSLDFRLRDASHIRDQILKLLQDLLARLDDARDIVAEATDPSYDDEIASDEDSDDEEPLSEIQELHKTVASTIKSLFLMSMLVRKPAQHDLRIGSKRSEVTAFGPYDYGHVRDKYPAANEALISRLGHAITRRRMYLKYRERHAAKLKQGISHVISATSGTDEPRAATVLSDTVATSAQGWNIDFDDQVSDAGASQTSYAATLMSGGAITIPPPPKESRDGDPFECPICYHIIKIESTRSWNKHVFLDLQPYICLNSHCITPQKLFATRHEWMAHLQICQSGTGADSPSILACPLCDLTFGDQVQLRRHSARHLQDLALFVLPSSLQNTEEDSDSAKSFAAVEHEANSSDESEGLLEPPDKLDQGEVTDTGQVKSRTLIGLLDGDEKCLDCGIQVQSRDLIGCTLCRAMYHKNCVIPPLPQHLSRDYSWYCDGCMKPQSATDSANEDPSALEDDAQKSVDGHNAISEDIAGNADRTVGKETSPTPSDVKSYLQAINAKLPILVRREKYWRGRIRDIADKGSKALDKDSAEGDPRPETRMISNVDSKGHEESMERAFIHRDNDLISDSKRFLDDEEGLPSVDTNDNSQLGHPPPAKQSAAQQGPAASINPTHGESRKTHFQTANVSQDNGPGNFLDDRGTKNIASTFASQGEQMVTPDRMRWYYRDQHGKTQGPWSGLQMHELYTTGYLAPELQIIKHGNSKYESLAHFIRRIGDKRDPFLTPQNGIPYDFATVQFPRAAPPSTQAAPRTLAEIWRSGSSLDKGVNTATADVSPSVEQNDRLGRKDSFEKRVDRSIDEAIRTRNKNQSEDTAQKPLDKALESDVPADARWTKIDRRLVSPEALATGNDRYEVREDHIVVFRPLTKQEIEQYANLTLEMKEEAHRTGEAGMQRQAEDVAGSSIDHPRIVGLNAGGSSSSNENTTSKENLTDESGAMHRGKVETENDAQDVRRESYRDRRKNQITIGGY